MIGNAHIDPVWLWRWPEGRSEVRATFASALDRLAEYPEFVFTQNQVLFLAWIADTDPAMFARIRAHVSTGRWQLAGGWWVEPDTNTPLGESLVRQGLYGQRFLAEHFGVRTDIGLCEDSFGHPAGLPQLLAGAGLDTYVFLRPEPHEMHLPRGVFTWRGPDGAAVSAFRIPNGYGSPRWDISGHIDKALGQLPDTGDVAIFYGVGNHGGGPTRANLDTIRRLADYSNLPEPVCSTLGTFFAAATPAQPPEVGGDLHRHAVGCYSAHSQMKRWMRRAERRLVEAERWASVAEAECGLAYPAADLRDAWLTTLFNQFHDTLAGTAIPQAYEDARDQLGHAATVAARTTVRSLQAVAGSVAVPPGPGQCFVVFNGEPAALRRLVEIDLLTDAAGPVRVEDAATGRVLPAQSAPLTSTTNGPQRRFLVVTDLPGLGYRTLRLVHAPDGAGLPEPARCLLAHEPARLDNGLVRLEIDRGTGRPVVLTLRDPDRAQAPVNLFSGGPHALVVEDPSDTWGHRVRAFDGPAREFGLDRIRLLEAGPVRRSVRVESSCGPNRLVEDYRLVAGSRFVDVDVRLDWASPHSVLKLRYPTRITSPVARWECAYGSVERAVDGGEQPLHGYVALSGDADGTAAGLAVLADGLSAGDVAGADVGLTAARSPLYAWHDPAPADAAADARYLDVGEHVFRVRLAPFLPDPAMPVPPEVTAAAADLLCPLDVVREVAHPGRAPARASFACVRAGTARLAVLKQAEDGDGLVLRIAETSGAATTARVRLAGTLSAATDLSIALGPHQVRTVRLPPPSEGASAEPIEVDLCEWAGGRRPPVQPRPPLRRPAR